MNHNPPHASSTRPSPLLDEFRAGVTACLRSWSALRAAVEGGWGGNESLAKAEDLRNHILQHMDGTSFPPRTFTIDDLEDNLAIYMEEEFSVVLEDGSERQVADVLWRMYEQCMKGDASLATHIRQTAMNALQQSSNYPVQVQSPEDDDDDEDDGDMDMDDGPGNDVTTGTAVGMPDVLVTASTSSMDARAYAAQPLFGPMRSAHTTTTEKPIRQLGHVPVVPPKTIVEVDEDGFAPVVKRRGRKH